MLEIIQQKLPTYGQLERELSQTISQLYREELGRSPSKTTCKFVSNNLAIVIEDSLTAIEQVLADTQESNDTIGELNSAINQVIRAKIKATIEQVLSVEVKDILFDTSIQTKRASAIATLSKIPQVRNPESIPKNRSSKKEL